MTFLTLILAVLAALAFFMDTLAPYSVVAVTLVEFRSEFGFELWIPLAALTVLAVLVDLRAAAAAAAAASEQEEPPPAAPPPTGVVDRVRALEFGVRVDIRSMPGIALVIVFDEMTPAQERRALETLFGTLATGELPGRARLMFRNELAERAGRLDEMTRRMLGHTNVRMLADREHVDLVFSTP